MSDESKSKANNKLVLIADDMRLNREILGQMVANIGLEAVFACNGFEAVEKFHEMSPCLVLMDINMPEMDGIEATRQIKQLSGSTFIPVIFVSGAEGQDVIRDAIDAGGDDYIARPFPFELLEGKIVALRRISELYSQVNKLNQIRDREADVAEQLFSGAVESANVATDQVRIHKQPAETFSGDVQLSAFRPNGELNVLLGDFTGHGLTATVGALPLSETFRAMTAKGYDAEEILAQINRKLHGLLPTGMFLATAMVTLSIDGSARIWNGGLPDVLVLSAEGNVRHRITSSHPPLAILRNLNELHFDMYRVEPEDHILLISDGVLEAEDEFGELFDEERFISSLSDADSEENRHIVDRVLSRLSVFVGDQAQKDDISLISIPGRVIAEEQQCLAPVHKEDLELEPSVLDVWNWNLELQGKSLARINPVAQALSRLQESEGGGDQWHSVFSILTELYVNALDHGVLKLESSIKSSPEGFTQYFTQREKKLESLTIGSVSLYMQHTRLHGGGRLMIRVEDSGEGFDYRGWMSKQQPTENVMFSGRGITLVNDLCESVRYSDNGSTVEVVYLYSA